MFLSLFFCHFSLFRGRIWCFSSVQSRSHVRLFATSWTAAWQASLSVTNSRSLLKLMSIELLMPSNNLILCCPLLLLPPIPPSIRVFSSESVLHIKWPKDWSLFQLQSFQWIFRADLLYDGLVGSPCSPRDSQKASQTPQFKSINSSVLSFLYNPISHPYMTTGKAIALTRWTFVDKVMSLFFNMLPRLVIGEGKWQPIPVFLPGESWGGGNLVGCHLWGRTESDTTEVT